MQLLSARINQFPTVKTRMSVEKRTIGLSKNLYLFLLLCIVCFDFWCLDVVVAGTDEFSGFSLFVGLNCSDLHFVYQHSGPAMSSSRVSLTFQANAPKVASCIGYRNNRTINNVPSGYSTDAKADICNLEVLGETCTRIIRGSVILILYWDQFKNQMAFLLTFHWLTASTKEFQHTCVI